jgi:hypothetical protein
MNDLRFMGFGGFIVGNTGSDGASVTAARCHTASGMPILQTEDIFQRPHLP